MPTLCRGCKLGLRHRLLTGVRVMIPSSYRQYSSSWGCQSWLFGYRLTMNLSNSCQSWCKNEARQLVLRHLISWHSIVHCVLCILRVVCIACCVYCVLCVLRVVCIDDSAVYSIYCWDSHTKQSNLADREWLISSCSSLHFDQGCILY